jgi:heme oxygenase
MEKFTLRLKKATKQNHTKLDTHEFVKGLYKEDNDKNAVYYLELHYIILKELQVLINDSKSDTVDCFKYFDKDYSIFKLSDLGELESVKGMIKKIRDDKNDEVLFMSHLYIWWLGVLFGGQMIKKLLNKNEELKEYIDAMFNFECSSRDLIRDFKDYLNQLISNDECEMKFIKHVNEMYLMIGEIFDEIINKMK